MHSFALTPRFVAIVEQPFAVDPLDFLRPGRPPIIANYRWKGAEPARVHLIDRRGGDGLRATVEVDPFFVFHHVNAYERGDRVVLDLCAHRDSSIIDALYLRRVRKGMAGKPSVRLRRLEIDPAGAVSRRGELADVDFELPRIDYARFNQRPYRYAYGVGQRTQASAFIDQLAKVDVRSGEALTWRERGCYPGRRCSSAARAPARGRRRAAVSRPRRAGAHVVPARARHPHTEGTGAGRGASPHPVRLPRAARGALAHSRLELRRHGARILQPLGNGARRSELLPSKRRSWRSSCLPQRSRVRMRSPATSPSARTRSRHASSRTDGTFGEGRETVPV